MIQSHLGFAGIEKSGKPTKKVTTMVEDSSSVICKDGFKPTRCASHENINWKSTSVEVW